MTRQSFLRLATQLVLPLFLSLGFTAAAHAADAQEVTVPYKLAAGESSKPIKLPKNIPVLLSGNQTLTSNFGVGQVIIHCVPSVPGLQWAGISYSAGAAYVNYYPAATFIMSLDTFGDVNINVDNASDCTIVISNTSANPTEGTVKLIY